MLLKSIKQKIFVSRTLKFASGHLLIIILLNSNYYFTFQSKVINITKRKGIFNLIQIQRIQTNNIVKNPWRFDVKNENISCF